MLHKINCVKTKYKKEKRLSPQTAGLLHFKSENFPGASLLHTDNPSMLSFKSKPPLLWMPGFTLLYHSHPRSSGANHGSVMSHAGTLIGCVFTETLKFPNDIKSHQSLLSQIYACTQTVSHLFL